MTEGERRAGWPWLATGVTVCALLFARGVAHGFPVPAVHDEFAYLLAADTFRAGRLTNPTHPCWEHFQTFHVLQHPSYQAKYPPGQGASLALGELVGGHPAFGVWLTMGAAAAATSWCLAAALPAGWAVLVTLAFVLHEPVLEHWGESYWGGGLALLGGSLCFGALLRLRRAFRARQAWIACAGLCVLASTRPFEGLIALLAAGLALVLVRAAAQGADGSEPVPRLLRRAALPLSLTLAVCAAGWLYYDWRVTGDPLRLPYSAWRAQDSTLPWMHRYHGSAPIDVPGKLRRLQHFYAGGVLALALPFLWFVRREPNVRFAALVVGPTALASVALSKAWPHYLAPVAGPILLLVGAGLRALAQRRGAGLAWGRWAAAAVIALHLGLSVQRQAARLARGPGDSWHFRRQEIVDELRAAGGRHLVLVARGPRRSLHEEWVFNAADIDGAAVVWAHDLGARENRALLEHMADRTVWTLRPEDRPLALRPLPSGG